MPAISPPTPPSRSRWKRSARTKKPSAPLSAVTESARAQNAGPLRGIAVGIKDIMDTADFPTEMGSPIYRGFRPRGDAAVVMMLKQAGATIIGKTTTTAFASVGSDADAQSAQSRPHARRIVVRFGGGGWGRHDPARAGDADRRFGDPAGLILRRRRDQAVVPHAADGRREVLFVDARYRRPVRGRRGRRGARAFRDDRPARIAAAVSIPTPRIGIVTQDFAGAPEASGAEALQIAAKAAERAGASVRELALPEIIAEAWRVHPVIQEFEAHQALAWEYRENYDAMAPLLRARLDESKGTDAGRL